MNGVRPCCSWGSYTHTLHTAGAQGMLVGRRQGTDRSGHRQRRSRGGDMRWSPSPGLWSRPGSRAEVHVWCEGTADPDLPVRCPGIDSALRICSTFFHFYFPSYPCRSRCRGRAGTWRWDKLQQDAGGCWLRVGGTPDRSSAAMGPEDVSLLSAFLS